MDENLKLLLAVIGAGGGTAFLTMMFKGVGKLVSGAAHREQVKNTSLEKQRLNAITERVAAEKERDEKVDKAENERDVADRKRREAEEHVAKLQVQIIRLGAEPIKHGTE